MDMENLSVELGRLAEKAGLKAAEIAKENLEITWKKDSSIVTRADLAAEEIIQNGLKKLDPMCPILSEESSPEVHEESRRFIVDPLDGTSNFANGFPWYCVSIAYEEEGTVMCAAVYIPPRKEVVTAARGRGAKCNGIPISVSKTNDLKNSLLGVGFYYHRDIVLDEEVERFKQVHRVAKGIRRPGSAVLDLISVARGWFDGFWEKGLKPWDLAAGCLIVEEAGGRLSTYDGSKHSIYGDTTVATNGLIHSELIETIKLKETEEDRE